MKKMLGLLAIAVSLAVGPAWAGEEFCDDSGGGPDPPETTESGQDPGSGSCEVNLAYTLSMLDTLPSEIPRGIRDIGFSDTLLRRLRNPFNEVEIGWDIHEVTLGMDTSQPSEARMIEWSFRPSDKYGVERMLAISLRRKEGEVSVMLDWLQSPAPDWSYATPSRLEPVWLDHRSIVLGGADVINQSAYLKWVSDAVVVGVWTGEQLQEVRFPLPSASWKPVRLRNSLLLGAPTQSGTQVSIGWPDAFRHLWSKPVPAPMGLPDEPVAPPDPTVPELQ
ncbi:hypothetical protein AZ78_3740 [Lysobacter capsici AZ78]|uniref:Uncharacterized protein n=1 Tax=Lysobacter capsici AZ78 TaxID=1444315 RepID=A0A125MND2_9GAMM|nr:hypothetical protein [Lysobacter capsici]KWS06186.1 hypothetical protein AZ78_3740 [Lysobacter capsici AZ78]